jgi:hypothetical protein
MFSSLNTTKSLTMYNIKNAAGNTSFDLTDWNVTTSFSMIRMTFNGSSSVSSAIGKLLNITVKQSNNSTITTRWYAYIRCGTSTTNILSTYGSVTNATNFSASFTSTSTVLLNQITEIIVTGLTFNTSYDVTLEFDPATGSTMLSKVFTVQTYNYGSGAVPPTLFKFQPWRRTGTTTKFYKCNISAADAPTDWKATSLYADKSNRGVWIMRETSGLLATNVTSVGKFPDQNNRAMEGVTDRGALIFGIQGIGVIKSNSAYSFQASSTYVLSCMVVQRNGELSNNKFDIFLDPNSLTNVTGAIKIGTMTPPLFSTTNWLYTSVTYTTASNFTSGNYYIRMLGTATTDLSLVVSNLELVKTA